MTLAKDAGILDFLNLLLECERAGAKALRILMAGNPPASLAESLPILLKDEARYCAGLTKQIVRLEGTPSTRTGDFLQKFSATEGLSAKFELLARGQHWVAKRIAEALPSIADEELRAFLEEMHQTHLTNVAACQRAPL